MCDLELEVGRIESVEHCLELHQLDLEVLIGLIMVGHEVIDCLKQGSEALAVVLLFKKELLLREDLDEIHQPVTRLPTQFLSVGSNVGEDCNDGLVDWLQQAGSVVNQLVNRKEDEVCIAAAEFRHIQLNLLRIRGVKVHG